MRIAGTLMAKPTSADRRKLDAAVWKACAGSSVKVPTAGAAVYYFPEGHAEQATSPPDFSSVCPRRSFYFPYVVDNVELLANPDTDEVFSRIRLVQSRVHTPAPTAAAAEEEEEEEESEVGWFVKVLTPSDANNGGGFSVPRSCADNILPKLNKKAEPPLQILTMRDVHGTEWEFRHIYRGTPRRHLLTTGWSKFVNSKRLIAGDSVVFVRNKERELFLGVRRAARVGSARSGEDIFARYGMGTGARTSVVGVEGGFSRRGRGRVAPEAVVEAVGAAEMGRKVEVVYYPKAGMPDFVVGKEDVDKALEVPWQVGVRVRMAVDTEEPSRTSWQQGTVMGIKVPEQCLWGWSPWRMLQVTWDEPEILPENVSPWQVEVVSETPEIPHPIAKRLKVQGANFKDIEQNMPFPTFGGDSRSANPPSIGYNTFPAGMQGARQDKTSNSSLSMIRPYYMSWINTEKTAEEVVPQRLDHVSTELSIGNPSSFETASPPSENTVLFPSPTSSFQLFGTIIEMERPVIHDAKLDDAEKGAVTDPHGACLSCQHLQHHEVKCHGTCAFKAWSS